MTTKIGSRKIFGICIFQVAAMLSILAVTELVLDLSGVRAGQKLSLVKTMSKDKMPKRSTVV
ncbi:hypothetical protein F9L33_04165 [Amylibacter sp. SFDW26]|uniref:hypothetical protein n=1 Tax=Amylibacter sp. SFDW26 TaxID=2652722 RepID=UPI001262466A|nr:hypothetical protein [Amylibacter sp. SFDW26]KAB7615964.1 hypothetical protein F9L33_04165 [Amylibacter sp. SFDW26]